MNNIIELKIDKSLNGLAGYEYGRKIYVEQVKENMDFSKNVTIIFPDNIQRLASSFIQGFFEDFINNIGIYGIENNVEIVSSNEKLKKDIVENLL